MLIGEDPSASSLDQKLYRQSFWRLGVIGMSAISEVARRAGVQSSLAAPCVTGSACSRIWAGATRSVYRPSTPPLIDLAQQVVARGYTAMKSGLRALLRAADGNRPCEEVRLADGATAT